MWHRNQAYTLTSGIGLHLGIACVKSWNLIHVCPMAIEDLYTSRYLKQHPFALLQSTHDQLLSFWLSKRLAAQWLKQPTTSTLTTQPSLLVKVWHRNQADTFTSGIVLHRGINLNSWAGLFFSLNRPLGRFSHGVAMSFCLSVCLSVCDNSKHPLPGALETSGRRAYR